MIRVEGLTKHYGNVPAIQDISFRVEKGEILGFLGPNGAGKSTTMRILTGFMPPTSGSAWVAEMDVAEHPLEVKRHIGYMPESNPLYLDMTVTAYLHHMAALKGVSGRARGEAVARVVDSCGLGNVASRIIGHLSKGYRQRVGLAQSLVNDPPVLILDEPTSGLDPAQIIEIRNLIRSLKGSRTIVLSTHILPEVSMVCDRVVVIHQGRVAAEGPIDALATGVQKEDILRVSAIGSAEALRAKLAAVPGVRQVSSLGASNGEVHFEVRAEQGREVRPDLAQAVPAASGRLTELRRERLTLEDLFVRIVSGEHKVEPKVDKESARA
ncbi:MAG: ATP-binding cassette domain-containing protein [Candidatus Tectomicrobia bacterium]|uniref:ATP-binding cassette domain-containing protein n=1 Tax=Tectimicrobiota bacterium TaxID=2528274 RepID=A0A932I2D2_UNCTE|nr:ATP-binding cassette domain-containing protein [Candidatus Tectomicrobia bacterium]